jgi:Bacterial dnaA protein helix-turn-helix
MSGAPLNPALPVSVREIIHVVAAEYGMPDRHLYGSGRDGDVAEARQVVCWIASDITGMASAGIAQVILRDGSAVRHAARTIAQRRDADTAFRARTDRLADAIMMAGHRVLNAMLADPDPVAAAERIARNPLHEATRVSTLEIAAMAVRQIELEQLAGATYQLLARCDIARSFTADGPAARDYAAGTSDLIGSIASTLEALGYQDPEETTNERETLNDASNEHRADAVGG